MVIRGFLLFFYLCCFPLHALTSLQATVSNNPVLVKETFVLEITADAQLTHDKLDYSVLFKDFIVGQVSTSRATNITNGIKKQTTSWRIPLVAKKKGQYRIPPLGIEGVYSQSVDLDVTEQMSTYQSQRQQTFVKMNVTETDVYLQQVVPVEVKLYLGMNLERGSLSEPELDGVALEKLGEDEESSEIINGKRYQVITRYYLLNTQRSGEFVIEPVVFNGEITSGRRSSFFSMLNKSKPVTAVSDNLVINVLPIPNHFNGDWLPANFLTINEKWQPETQEYQVGDPITRTITVSAVGVKGEQITVVPKEYPDILRAYPDQPKIKTVVRNQQVIGQRIETIALIPNKMGEVYLPEIKIPWFNTKKKIIEYATLAAKTLNIQANSNGSQFTPTPPITIQAIEEPETTTLLTPVTATMHWLNYIFAGLWVLTLIGWFSHVQGLKQTKKITAEVEGIDKNSHINKQIIHACETNNYQKIQKLLPIWYNNIYKEAECVTVLDVLNHCQDQSLTNAIDAMNQHCYSSRIKQWPAKKLLPILKSIKQKQQVHSQQLPTFYVTQ